MYQKILTFGLSPLNYSIRDQLHSKYKSSTKAKKQRRKELEKKRKESGSISPKKDVEERSVPGKDDALKCDPEPIKLLDYQRRQSNREDALSLMLMAPIGESFLSAETLQHY